MHDPIRYLGNCETYISSGHWEPKLAVKFDKHLNVGLVWVFFEHSQKQTSLVLNQISASMLAQSFTVHNICECCSAKLAKLLKEFT